MLMIVNKRLPHYEQTIATIDALPKPTIDAKITTLRTGAITRLFQREQRDAPGSRIIIKASSAGPLLEEFASYHNGIVSGDYPRFGRAFWEFPAKTDQWTFQQWAADRVIAFGGRRGLLRWDGTNGEFLTFLRERLGNNTGAWLRGLGAWGKRGVSVSGMRSLAVTTYDGTAFDNNSTVLVPHDDRDFLAIWAYCSSPEYTQNVRLLNRKVSVTDDSFVKVPFDASRWRKAASEAYPDGLVSPLNDETQWVFEGGPTQGNHPVQVAVARALGYLWPRQTGSSFPDCPSLQPDALAGYADCDGILCLASVKSELKAADHVRGILAAAYGADWSSAKQNELLADDGYGGKTIEDWLRDGFFAQHCNLFQQRPFIWQIWDGVKDGFSALLNYHKLAAPNGEGLKTLEKLLYSYLGDWVERQRADQKRGVEGADLKLAAAEHLAAELEKIIQGEPPYDIFVRWKPLHQQPIGWEPDINDGVRINIRPFMTARPYNAKAKNACILRVTPNIKWGPKPDRGNEPTRPKDDFPWFWSWDGRTVDFRGGASFDGKRWSSLHYTPAVKEQARELAKRQETSP